MSSSPGTMGDCTDQFSCGLCQENFHNFLTFIEHKLSHKELLEEDACLNCLLCSETLEDALSLRKHLYEIHALDIGDHDSGESDSETLAVPQGEDGDPQDEAEVDASQVESQASEECCARCCQSAILKFNLNKTTKVNPVHDPHSGSLLLSSPATGDVNLCDASNLFVDVVTQEDSLPGLIGAFKPETAAEDFVQSKNEDRSSLYSVTVTSTQDLDGAVAHKDGSLEPCSSDITNISKCLNAGTKSTSYQNSLSQRVEENGLASQENDKYDVPMPSSKLLETETELELLKVSSNHCNITSTPLEYSPDLCLTDAGNEATLATRELSETEVCHHQIEVSSKSELDGQDLQSKENAGNVSIALSVKDNENSGNVEKENTSKDDNDEETKVVDFHFLLGTTNIKGNSMSYERTEFRCMHCAFSTAWRPSLIKHMKYAHKDTLVIHEFLDIKKCDTPKEGSKSSKSFQVMKMSEYIAGTMKAKASKRRVRNVERQDIPGKYHCPICHKVFSRLRYIRRHQSSHHTERPHLCDACGKSFKTKATLVAHRRSHKTKSYHCPQCSFVSNNSAAIHLHRQLHPNGSVVCDICGAAYIDKSTLKKHRRVHDTSRPFPCTHPGCTWRFKTDVMRKAHVRAHTTQGKFRCPHCGYHFRQKHHLQRHVAKLHASVAMPSSQAITASLAHSLSSAAASLPVHNLSGPDQAPSVFTRQALPVSTDLLTTALSAPDGDGKPVPAHDLVGPGLNGQTDVFSSPPSHLLCAVSDSTFTPSLMEADQTMIEVLVGDKHENLTHLEPEEDQAANLDIPIGNLNNLEYITDSGEIVQLLRPGQTYMGRDQQGNLVQYKIADAQDPDEVSSHPIYFIGVDGTVVGTANSQEQALLVTTRV